MSTESSQADLFISQDHEDEELKNVFPDQPDSMDVSINDHPQAAPKKTFCQTAYAMVCTIIPAGSIAATVFSTSATCIGGGILGLPSAFSKSGAIASAIWLLAIGVETAYSLRLLAITAEKTGKRSYEQLANDLLGPFGKFLVAAMRFINCLGSMVAYVKSIGNLLRPILEGADGTPTFLLQTSGFHLLQALLWLVFFFPLIIPRQVNQLRYISTAGVLGMIFFTFCVLAHFATSGKSDDVDLFHSGNLAVQGMGVFLFTYVCQINVVELYFEMENPTVPRFTLCACLSMLICWSLYTITGLFGYLEFGNSVGGSVLLLYNPIKEPQIFVSYIFVFIKLAASYGLFGNATRGAVYQALGWEPTNVSIWLHLLFSVILALVTVLLGLFVEDVNTVFEFVGGLCGGFLGFILPSLFYMYSGNWGWKTVGWGNYIATYLVLFAGVVAVVFGTGSSIFQIVTG